MLRTSWSRSFRAPSLSDLYSADSESADWAKDYVYCEANGISAADCPNRQYTTTRTSNEDLKEETADTWNFGVAYSPVDDLNLPGLLHHQDRGRDPAELPAVSHL